MLHVFVHLLIVSDRKVNQSLLLHLGLKWKSSNPSLLNHHSPGLLYLLLSRGLILESSDSVSDSMSDSRNPRRSKSLSVSSVLAQRPGPLESLRKWCWMVTCLYTSPGSKSKVLQCQEERPRLYTRTSEKKSKFFTSQMWGVGLPLMTVKGEPKQEPRIGSALIKGTNALGNWNLQFQILLCFVILWEPKYFSSW